MKNQEYSARSPDGAHDPVQTQINKILAGQGGFDAPSGSDPADSLSPKQREKLRRRVLKEESINAVYRLHNDDRTVFQKVLWTLFVLGVFALIWLADYLSTYHELPFKK